MALLLANKKLALHPVYRDSPVIEAIAILRYCQSKARKPDAREVLSSAIRYLERNRDYYREWD